MLVIIKSSPDAPEARQALDLAASMHAEVCLVQNAVGFCLRDRLKGFSGTVYALGEDMTLRGLAASGSVRSIDYEQMIDLMTGSDKVVGMF